MTPRPLPGSRSEADRGAVYREGKAGRETEHFWAHRLP